MKRTLLLILVILLCPFLLQAASPPDTSPPVAQEAAGGKQVVKSEARAKVKKPPAKQAKARKKVKKKVVKQAKAKKQSKATAKAAPVKKAPAKTKATAKTRAAAGVATAAALATGSDPYPTSARAYLVQVDGKTVWSHQPERRLPPASITKIMTALLVLERANLNDVITVGPSVTGETGHRIHLRPGDRLQVRDLLAGMLIPSGNDAAHVLAVHVAGSEERFAALMNARATQLGMFNTHFTNSAGHHDPDHYTTAGDLLKLTRAALERPLFRELVSTVKYDIRTVDGKRRFKLENSNKLLPTYAGMAGIKTGYTPQAGRCLVTMARRGDTEVLVVMLRASDRWKLAERMLDNAFARYTAGGATSAGAALVARK